MVPSLNKKRTWLCLTSAALISFAVGIVAIDLSWGMWNVPLPNTIPAGGRTAEGMAESRRAQLAVEKQNVRNLLMMIGTAVPVVFCIGFGLARQRFALGLIGGIVSAAIGAGLAWFAGPEICGLGNRLIAGGTDGVLIALAIHVLFWVVVGVAVGIGSCTVNGFQLHHLARGVLGALVGSTLFVMLISIVNGDSVLEHVRQEERQNQLLWLAAPLMAMTTFFGIAPTASKPPVSLSEQNPV